MAKPGLSSVWQPPSGNRQETTSPARWHDRTGWHIAAAAVLLAVACMVLHGTAISGGWHSDDGAHLNFVTQFAPWQYFFVPEVMLQQSYAHITPWNALFYDMGLPLFGLQPEGHYVHLLAVLWLTALATFVLLRQWLSWAPALAGAVLFLAMPATGTVARLLMTGHYAYGLLFSVLALLAFSRAARHNSLAWGALAAVAYALACLCKELYVPLVAVLLCWPEGSMRARLRIAAPVLVVAITYAVWRLWLLQGAGGYAEADNALKLHDAWLSLKYLRDRAVGPDEAGWLATGCALGLAALSWVARKPLKSVCITSRPQRRRQMLFLAAWVPVLMLPLVSLILAGRMESTSGRLLVFVGWALAVGVAFLLPAAWRRTQWLTALMFVGLLGAFAVSQLHIADEIAVPRNPMVQQNKLLASGEPGALVAYQYKATGYLRSIALAAVRLHGGAERVIVQDEEALVALGTQAGAQAWMYAMDCRCMRRLGSDYATLVEDFTDRLALGRERGATVKVKLSFEGPRQRKLLRWKIDGTSLGASQLEFYVQDMGWRVFPLQDSWAFGLDATANLVEAFQLRLSLKLPDGALVRSPLLSFPLDRPSEVHWSGADPPVKMITATSMP